MEHGMRMPDYQKGVLRVQVASEITLVAERLRDRTRMFSGKYPSSSKTTLLSEFSTNLLTSLHHISSTLMKFHDLICGFVEVQQAWLYSIAVLDFVESYEHKDISAQGSRVSNNPRLGAFKWNNQDASKLFDVGIPVYYIRSYNTFSSQVVRSCTSVIHPHPSCLKAALPPHPMILASAQAGCDAKFASIRRASIRCFDVASPFANMHLPGLYTTSYSLSTVLGASWIISPTQSTVSTPSARIIHTTPKKARYQPYAVVNSRKTKGGGLCRFRCKFVDTTVAHYPHEAQLPLDRDDRFRDFPPNEYLPPVMSAWRGANLKINVRHPGIKHSSGQCDKLHTLVPDPVLFFGSNDKTKWQRQLQTWTYIRQNWIAKCASSVSELVSASTWKTVLSLGQLGAWDTTRKPQKPHQHEQEAATLLVASTFAALDRPQNPFPFPSVEVSPHESQQLMRELSLVNFRHQLLALDAVADCSALKPSLGFSQHEHNIQLLRHHCEQDQLLMEAFGSEAAVGSSLVCNIFADAWVNCVEPLRALSKLLETWQGGMKAERLWDRRNNLNLPQLVGPGMEWEAMLIRHYIQTYYNFFGYPSILPRA
ncbi:hypothetical protein V5O48_015527 [Marasmius crinis-equi]|uniref:Uncharacterized protein n=1 Tax=Marasmius crinis-equi TaxID=585013 RepID=A0ABR3EUB3_9AGAR